MVAQSDGTLQSGSLALQEIYQASEREFSTRSARCAATIANLLFDCLTVQL